MTPKQKAKKMLNEFNHVKFTNDDFLYFNNNQVIKLLALKSVKELLKVSKYFKLREEYKYWKEVKKEIEAL